jgi:hypothetical protein
VHINPKPPYQNEFGRGEKEKMKNLMRTFENFEIQKISKILENYSNLH